MQITIDTSKDSHEEIRKAISLLASIIGQDAHVNAPAEDAPREPEQETAATNDAFVNMFGAQETAPAPADESSEEIKKDTADDIPNVQIVEY